jgi:hypothetical protein
VSAADNRVRAGTSSAVVATIFLRVRPVSDMTTLRARPVTIH